MHVKVDHYRRIFSLLRSLRCMRSAWRMWRKLPTKLASVIRQLDSLYV